AGIQPSGFFDTTAATDVGADSSVVNRQRVIVNIQSGGAIFDTSGHTVALGASLSHPTALAGIDGGVTLNDSTGSGTMIMNNAASTFNGGLIVKKGTVMASVPFSPAKSLSTTVAAGGSTTVTLPAGSTTLGLGIGQTVSGGGLPAGTVITAIPSTT